MKSRNCEICNIDVHRASYVKHLRSENYSEKEKQNEIIILEWLFKESIEKKSKIMYSPKSL